MARVLIVEDEQWVADCYRTWLQHDGHQIYHARDAQVAIDEIDAGKPDVIVLDLFLPLANGLQLLHTLRSYADITRIPVILCSSALPLPLPDLAPYGVRTVLDKTEVGPAVLRRSVKDALGYAAV